MADNKQEDLAVKLYNIDAVKFGDFMTKSGIKTPVYFDLRVIVSYPEIMELISSLIYDLDVKENNCEHLCGVPYTALPIATMLSVRAKKSMLMRRKESKGYGTKKTIEGHYKAGQTCLIIEDVVTSGSSILETVNDLTRENLIVNKAVIILDREQGGKENLAKNGIEMKSLFTMSSLLEYLKNNQKITEETANKVLSYLNETKAPETPIERIFLPYEQRASMALNPITKKLFNIMDAKKTNLCISVDLTSATKILELLEKVGNHVCLVKTHVDIIEDFSCDFITQLIQLASKYNFLILEDRKFADIGNTVSLQYKKGNFKVAEWADCVTVHSLPGESILKAFKASDDIKDHGVFLLAQMSSEGNLITPEYTAATVEMAAKHPDLITGFVCQNRTAFKNPGLIQLTPGVQLNCPGDGHGQIYNTPETVILEKGADIAVVGRGIIAASDPESQAIIYKESLWKSYLKRVSGKLE